ncbi:MAG TPA: DUF3710 domain-containing protein [Streptosporangiaceae bacterium]|nr:DUF3710 domain-containing protein [Streptosporangiaceae bacterium]
MLRRRRREAESAEAGPTASAGEHEEAELSGPEEAGEPEPPQGPWDIDDDFPATERIDFGSLQVPAGDGHEVQVGMAGEVAAWVTVVTGESSLQVQAFAAPRNDGLWDEVREEIAAEVSRSGGESSQEDGPFGLELRARVTAPPEGQGAKPGGLQPVRFLGVDGPRWFLRGVISGPAARRDDLAEPLERVFADVVVARGEHPMPPRELLEIRLPLEVRQAIAQQLGEPLGEDEEGTDPPRWAGVAPFERGPEITETR